MNPTIASSLIIELTEAVRSQEAVITRLREAQNRNDIPACTFQWARLQEATTELVTTTTKVLHHMTGAPA